VVGLSDTVGRGDTDGSVGDTVGRVDAIGTGVTVGRFDIVGDCEILGLFLGSDVGESLEIVLLDGGDGEILGGLTACCDFPLLGLALISELVNKSKHDTNAIVSRIKHFFMLFFSLCCC